MDGEFHGDEINQLVQRCGPPIMWVNDDGAHFNNCTIRKAVEALNATQRFSVAISAWTNGSPERVIGEVIHMAKAILNEHRRLFSG